MTGRHLPHIRVGQGRIRGAKINRARLHLLNTAATANRLVVDLHIRMRLMKVLNPAPHHGIDKSAARSIERDRAGRRIARGQ